MKHLLKLRHLVIYFTILFLLFSCSPIIIKENGENLNGELKGKVKEMVEVIDYSPIREHNEHRRTYYYDKNNKITKRIGDYKSETVYKDDEKGSVQSNSSNTCKYDKYKNLTVWHYESGDIHFTSTYKYDKHHNLVEEKTVHHRPELDYSIIYIIDYKKRTIAKRTFDSNGKEHETFDLSNYDSKGFKIKTRILPSNTNEWYQIFLNDKYSYMCFTEFDESGNRTKEGRIYWNGKTEISQTFKNSYDKSGNLTEREEYSKDFMFKKTTYKITYW